MSYMGAKNGSGVYQAIIGLMPPHDTYIEPFVGSGAILQRKPAAASNIALDLNPECIDALRRVSWVESYLGDGIAFLERQKGRLRGRTVIYADPPYLHHTRSSAARYVNEFEDADHVRLAKALLALEGEAAIIVSGYPSVLYDELYATWNTMELQAMTRGGPRTEKLWFNFDPGVAHWHTLAGKDFTDRQRIKRKAARWAAKFEKLGAAERQAVLSAVLAVRDPT